MGVWSSPQLLRPRRRVWVGCARVYVCVCVGWGIWGVGEGPWLLTPA